jgi:hypothetical protein
MHPATAETERIAAKSTKAWIYSVQINLTA